MQGDLQRICALLQHADGMRRCAAAMVLTELAPAQPAVVNALGQALTNATPLLTRYILEAFEAIGTRAVVPYVLPLLDAPEVETKLRAINILARTGDKVVPAIQKQLANATPPQRMVLADVLARIHSTEAFGVLLELLFDPDFELVKETCQAVRRHSANATPKQRLTLHNALAKFLGSKPVKDNDRVLTSCLLLIGYIGAPPARAVLLQHASPKHLGYIRRNALLGLKGLAITGPAATQTAQAILPCLDEPDPIIAQHALDILEHLPPESLDAVPWRKLLANPHPPVRAFATRRLAATDDTATNKRLLELIAHEDPQVSDIAAGALAHHPQAAPLLLQDLLGETDDQRLWRLAKILKPHASALPKPALKKLSDLATGDLGRGAPRYEALLYVLRHADPAAAEGVLRTAGLKFMTAQKWPQAIECFRQLVNTESFDNELRFQLSVCNLKQSPKELAPHLRAEDHALRGFHGLLLNPTFPLLARLRKQTVLAAPDLCYLGFHFAEHPGPTEAGFGRNLLEQILKRWPKSPEAKAAKNKLKLAK